VKEQQRVEELQLMNYGWRTTVEELQLKNYRVSNKKRRIDNRFIVSRFKVIWKQEEIACQEQTDGQP
jgi:hypothetical protein